MARRRAPSDDGAGSRDRSAFTFRRHREFNRSLGELSPVARATVVAELEKFWQRWKKVDSDAELSRSHWQYKPLQGNDAKRWRVRQIRLHDYRAALTVVTEARTVWLLEVYEKGEQEAAIERAIKRARAIREGQ